MTSPAKAPAPGSTKPGSLPASSSSRRPGGTQTEIEIRVIATGHAMPLRMIADVRVGAEEVEGVADRVDRARRGEEQPGQTPPRQHRRAAHDECEEEHVADRVDEEHGHPELR